MPPVSDIKLIRTDTTLDLSQKAEKVVQAFASAWRTSGTFNSLFKALCIFPSLYLFASAWLVRFGVAEAGGASGIRY